MNSTSHPLRVGITGSNGFIGWHLRCLLSTKSGLDVIPAKREWFTSYNDLVSFTNACDVVIHLAGLNRGPDGEVFSTNVSLARSLIAAAEKSISPPGIIFASSIQIDSDNEYGQSKKECTQLFQAFAEKSGSSFTSLILPNVFGEYGRPFYNSVVSTFCYQLAESQEPRIIEDREIEVIHVQDVADIIYEMLIVTEKKGARPRGKKIQVGDLLKQLRSINEAYRGGIVPETNNRFLQNLFNTYRAYLFPKYYPVRVEAKKDTRGDLIEVIKAMNKGQGFLSITHPGVTRGNHYHFKKFERFFVVKGEALVKLRRLFSTDVFEYRLSGSNPQYIDIPTLYTHNIENIGDGELTTFFWANEIFDPKNTDTLFEDV